MKKLVVYMILLLASACVSPSLESSACDFYGFSFCLSVPGGFEAGDKEPAIDFSVYPFLSHDKQVAVLIYEGNFPYLGPNSIKKNAFYRKFGAVRYRVEAFQTEASSYEVVLTRDDVDSPVKLHIYVRNTDDEKAIISEILRGLKGCKEFPASATKCKL